MTPDQLTLAGGLITLALLWVFMVATTPPQRPLAPGRLVQVDAGEYAGLCGWIDELTLDVDTGVETCVIQLNDLRTVRVPRADVSPLLG